MSTEFKQGDVVRHKSKNGSPSMVVNGEHTSNNKTIYCTYFNAVTGIFMKQQFDLTEIEHYKD